MDLTLVVATGVAIALGLGIASWLQQRKNAKFADKIEPLLCEHGGMTLMALASALGMPGFYARGKVVLALNEMVSQGRIEIVPAPAGTPQLKKVDFIQYRLRS